MVEAQQIEICLLQTAIDGYRQQVIDGLYEELGEQLLVVTGDRYFDPSVKSRVQLNGKSLRVSNAFLLRRSVVWQRGAVRAGLVSDVLIAELNPRVLSTWAILIARRFCRRPTILWGHAWPRRGSAARSDAVRHLMRRLADVLIVYTIAERDELRPHHSGKPIFAAPNALYRARTWSEPETGGQRDSFLSVGRLVPSKKPTLALRGFALAMPALEPDVRLVFAGDGVLAAQLAREADALGISDRVDLIGHVGDETKLENLYRRAIASLSPGYVGLSLIQSIWYGVPMIIARDEPHAPEIEAASSTNTMFVSSDSPEEWAHALVAIARPGSLWGLRRRQIAREARDSYSVELMIGGILNAISEASRRRRPTAV